MRIVVAPDKFRGSLSAHDVAAAIAAGLARALPDAEIVICPMADGGEGTVDAFIERGFGRHTIRACGPLGDPLDASFAFDGTTAVIEMAAASGLVLLPEHRRDPRRASTFGTGDLLRAALDLGASRVIVGIGGSATNDAGAGFAQALGAHFYDKNGEEIMAGGAALAKVERIDVQGLDPRLAATTIQVACDVDNPLCGPSGASAMYGPQKGASPKDVALLDAALAHFADVVAAASGRDLREVPGAGAAGGLGFGLLAFAGATMEQGVALIAKLVDLPGKLAGADFCVSGEGRIDGQTLRGKTVAGVAALARAQNIPVIAIGGAVDPAAESELARAGIVCMPICNAPMPLENALRDARALVTSAAERLGRTLALGAKP